MEKSDSERLVTIETIVNRMDEQLFGNGQPGIIEKLAARIDRLERYLGLAIGGGIVAVWIIERFIK